LSRAYSARRRARRLFARRPRRGERDARRGLGASRHSSLARIGSRRRGGSCCRLKAPRWRSQRSLETNALRASRGARRGVFSAAPSCTRGRAFSGRRRGHCA